MNILGEFPLLTSPIEWQALYAPVPAVGSDESGRKKAERQARWKAEVARLEQVDRVEREPTARRKHQRVQAALGGLTGEPGE